MIIKFSGFQRPFYGTALFAGIFSAASAFALPQAATPSFSPAAGAYTSAQSVTITSATSGASIAYTTDGTIPTESGGVVTHGKLYSGPITVSPTTTLSAIAFESGYLDSAVAIDGYTLQENIIPSVIAQVAAPAFSPGPGRFRTAAAVTIASSTTGASIRYTTDGSTPTETNGTLYTATVYFTTATTFNAIAYETGFSDSPVTTAAYTFNLTAAPGLNVLYNFSPANNGGYDPFAGLIQGSDGNFYGTASSGGSSGGGTVFKMTPAGAVTTLVSFDGTNGQSPEGTLMQGSDGNFYGTTDTRNGGDGIVFKLASVGGVWTLATLHSFTGNPPEGFGPDAAVIQASDGNFYGTTAVGGAFDNGTVFGMTPAGVLTTLASFNGTNGGEPLGGVIQGSDGNFYGTTQTSGGLNGDGTVFRVTSTGALTSLVSFTGANGAYPTAALALGADGNFYGTTSHGGSANFGTIFRMTPAGALTTLVTFTGANGNQPMAGLVLGSDGNFYGTTEIGGAFNNGTVFKMTPAGVLTTLVSFNGANGGGLLGGVVQGSDGNLYGMTAFGGLNAVIYNSFATGAGTIFQVVLPSSVAAPVFSLAAGTFSSAQAVTMTTTTSGAAIAYTIDGSTPTEAGGAVTNGTLYSGAVAIGSTTVLNAIAFESGMDSSVTSATYMFNTPPAGGGGGAPSWWFLGFLVFAGILRRKLRKVQGLKANEH